METRNVPSVEEAIEEALRRLVGDPRTRHSAIGAIEAAVASAREPEREKMRVLARINREELTACIRRLQEERYEFDQIADDSPEAHRKVADIQRILRALGFELGPAGVDGYTGGPPGKPVALSPDEIRGLARRASPQEKLLGVRPNGATESWTRDATRRLQHFLGTVGLPRDSELRAACLTLMDGLFGARTLAGVREFLEDVESTR